MAPLVNSAPWPTCTAAAHIIGPHVQGGIIDGGVRVVGLEVLPAVVRPARGVEACRVARRVARSREAMQRACKA